MLGRLLSRHPEIAYSNEPRLVWRFGNDRKSDLLVPGDASERVKRHIHKHFQQFLSAEGKERLLEKTPSNALRLAFVREIFPECKVIHIIRNGYDSALSIRNYWNGHTSGINYSKIDGKESILVQRLKEMHPSQIPYYSEEILSRLLSRFGLGQRVLWGPRFPGMRQFLRDTSVLTVSALQWRYCVELACGAGRKMPASQYREIRLEELVPERTDELLEFCELGSDSAIRDYYCEHFQSDMSGSRKRCASQAELQELSSLIDPTMQWLGYDTLQT